MIKPTYPLFLAIAALALSGNTALATVAYGDLNNFDSVNNTGHKCHGFEIELDGIHSTDITYTYDWNHYGAPIIREDVDPSGAPRTFVRYTAKTKDTNGQWLEFTNAEDPTNPIGPTGGHLCTNPSVNQGCEHFGVGFAGAPTAVKYNWLVDDGSGGGSITTGEPVSVATPVWIPIGVNVLQPVDPALNPIAQVQAVIPAPVEPIPPAKQFGEASWVKVIKTTSHNAKNLPLKDLVGVDNDGDGKQDWSNGEPDEVETEWHLLQTNNGVNSALAELAGKADALPGHNETVTRRYEFYTYGAGVDSIDGEQGEAMCSEVNPTTDPQSPDYLHGIGVVGVTDANGGSHDFDCSAVVVVGDYTGVQMAGFDPQPELGLIDHIQDWDTTSPDPYTDRTVIIGGKPPYTVTVTAGAMPNGLGLDGTTGILSQTGAPVEGNYGFTLQVSDQDGAVTSRAYTMKVGNPVAQQYQLTVAKSGNGGGTVSDANVGIDCGTTCASALDIGTAVSLAAAPDVGSVFAGWSGACVGTATCDLSMDADKAVTAIFNLQKYQLSVSKLGTGSGSVSGNGINCGAACTTSLDYGTAVSLKAAATAGSVFSGWGGACAGTADCVIPNMDAAKNVTATFTLQNYMLTVNKTGSGTVTGGAINCGSTCSTSVAAGTSVTLTATPASGYGFSGWGGSCGGTASTCTVNVNAATSVSATFVPKYTLTVTKKNGSYGSVSSNPAGISCGSTCSSTYNSGTAVTLTATPVAGRQFSAWSGACSGTASTCTVTMNAKKSVTATFK